MQTIAEIFNNVFFRVPDYQRGFSWEEGQLEDFWKDLNWLRPEHQHYTGMITLHPIRPNQSQFPPNAPHTAYHLVDGQQRLTTAFMLIKKLIQRAENGMIAGQPVSIVEHCYVAPTINGNQIPIFGYDAQSKMEFFQSLIQQQDTTNKKVKISIKNIYERNLLAASKFFDKRLNKMPDDDRDILFNKITKQLVFDVHKVTDSFEVCAMFESINYRGKKLTKFEVLKNRLMYLCELLSRSNSTEIDRGSELRKNIELVWGEAFDWFGYGEEPLDEDDFLLQHSIMYFGALPKEKEALDNRLFKDKFTTDRLAQEHKNPLSFGEMENYVNNIRISSMLWAFQNSRISTLPSKPAWLSKGVVEWLLRLNRLGMRHFKPLILGALNQIQFDGTTETTRSLVELLVKIERFIFILYGLCDYYANESSKSLFADYGSKIFENDSNYSFENVGNDVDNYLFSFDDDDVFCGAFSRERFVDKVHARFIGDRGWRDWDEIKYFLSEWEVHFDDSGRNILSPNDYANYSIEHIMPGNADAPGQWQDCQAILGKRFKYVLQDLGNLMLLRLGANKAVHDVDLKSKAAAYEANSAGRDVLKRAGRNHRWSEAHILKRGHAMVEYMCTRWKIPGQERGSDLKFEYEDVLSKNVKPPRQRLRSA